MWLTLAFLACTASDTEDVVIPDIIVPDDPEDPTVSVVTGYDWTLPEGASAGVNAGLFSEAAEGAIGVHVVDVTWAQLEPEDDVWSSSERGSAQDMDFASLDEQLSEPGPYWLRIWTSGVDWAPDWVREKCDVSPISGRDYDGQRHFPIWDECVWSEIREMYSEFLVDRGLLADDNLVLVYVPGAFTWAEFDYDMVNQAVDDDGLTRATFEAWFETMTEDLADLEPEYTGKLVFTGEDYPYGPFGSADDFYARDAVAAGMGIRTGIGEVSNNHLSEVPAYGVQIAANGHLVTDETWPLVAHPESRIIGGENECFNNCGYHTDDPEYAVRMANFKALQLRTTWLYVVNDDSYLQEYPEHWAWVTAELGHTAATAFDAWAVLRDAEDHYWTDEETGPNGAKWEGYPYVKNLERWLVQVDVAPDGVSQRGTDVREGVLDDGNGTAYEGRRTAPTDGVSYLYFDVNDIFAARVDGRVLVKVAFVDEGTGTLLLEYPSAVGARSTPVVERLGTGTVRTATFSLPDATFDGSFSAGTDFRLYDGGDALEVRFVRVVPP